MSRVQGGALSSSTPPTPPRIFPLPATAQADANGVAGEHEGGIADADDELPLSAVARRLRHCVGPAADSPDKVRRQVLECAQTLERLQTRLLRQRAVNLRMECEWLDARDEIAALRRELHGTQAGELQALHQAQHDSLTALPNRSHFQARLADMLGGDMRQPPPLAVFFLDLDAFKPINDHHGHDAGDETLRIVAQRLRRSMRATDLVCRFGGDEFACLLAATMSRAQLAQLAAKLVQTVAAPLKVGALEFRVRPSVGIATCPDDGVTAAALLKRADTAMYRAKRHQLGYAFYDARADA